MKKQKKNANVTLCDDGVYRWAYEFDMYRNPSVLFTLLKIFGWIIAGLWAFSTLLSCGNRDFWWKGFLSETKTFLIFGALFLVFVAAGYYLYAVILGGKYCVLFEMDEKGVRHTQLDKQFKKAQVIGALTALAGAASGRPGTTGAGILAGSHNSTYSDFASVRRVRAFPGRETIKVDHLLTHNQVYAEKADFEFVREYILARVPQNVKKGGIADGIRSFFVDGGSGINGRKLAAVILAAANFVLLGLIISGGHRAADGAKTDADVSSPVSGAISGAISASTTAPTLAGEVSAFDFPDYSGVGAPAPAEFDWFINGVSRTMQPQEGSEDISGFGDILGRWKCLILYYPDSSPAEQGYAFCNADISGAEDAVTVTLDWYVLVFGGETIDQSSESDSVYTGAMTDGVIKAVGPGSFSLERFYRNGGKQYAIGVYNSPSGEPARIALVRP